MDGVIHYPKGRLMSEQHDAHVRLSRTERTVFFAELGPGQTVEVRATYGMTREKLSWAVLRVLEAKSMELDGSWHDDLARLEAKMYKQKDADDAGRRSGD